MIGIIFCFISWIMIGISFILNYCYNGFMGKMWILPGYVVNSIATTIFQANAIQYNIDQIIGASTNELSTIIYWSVAAYSTSWIVCNFLIFLDSVNTKLIIIIITSGVALSLILVSHSLFKHKLENISLIKNPVKLIVRVLCYARKHKYPENRSALTYWEEEAPSRLDLGKEKYGGPFTEEEVEDVKTIFRMLPLYIAVIAYTTFHWLSRGNCINKSPVHCMLFEHYDTYDITVLLLFFIYQFIIRVCFHKYIPSMLTRMGIGLLVVLLGCITKILVQVFLYDSLLILQQVLLGISYILTLPTAYEFTVAQSPEHMRGMMVGLCYSSLGIGTILSRTFLNFITTWYDHAMVCVLQLFVLIMFAILARRYKYRVRENEVNIVQIVDDHYQRYMEQEDEHERQQEILENELIFED
uniref:Major facilitator superfamily (MFS) profile domain-containing protein n=1 Tax=Amphimedon queenslandica TaxID=400682 RepID=A0A1X7UU57_AMPQE